MSKKTIFILLGSAIGLILLLVGLKKGVIIGNNDESKVVELSKVAQTTIVETVSATGKIQPEIEVKISSEVSGEIIALPIKEGQQVKKGDLLVRINPDLYESGVNRSVASMSTTKAGLSQADAQVKEAKANYDRNQKLFEKGIISKAEWDRIVSAYEVAVANKQSAYYQVKSASATVTEANDNLRRTTIYAPADGTISLLNVELGERVLGTQQMAGTEILRIANLNNMEVEVDVNENDIVKVNIGDSANIEVDAYLKREFKGIVTSISNSASTALTADQVTNFKVKVRILKESYQDLLEGKPENYSPFRPGMTATVDIITERKEKKARIAKKKKERLNKKNKIDKNGSNVHLMKMPFANISAEKRKEFVKVFQEENIKILSDYANLSEKEKIEIKSLKRGECLMFVGDEHILTKIDVAEFEKEIIV